MMPRLPNNQQFKIILAFAMLILSLLLTIYLAIIRVKYYHYFDYNFYIVYWKQVLILLAMLSSVLFIR